MIDRKYKCKRYIAEYSDTTDEFLAEYELSSFDLEKFQVEFGEYNTNNPMFDCYPIKEENIDFLRQYIDKEPKWDFESNAYFVEAHAI